MLNVISLGAGVQSSTMALMAAHGELDVMPDCAIFADTQREPAQVMDWLDYLEQQIKKSKHPFPVYRVTAGDLGEAATRVIVAKKKGHEGNTYLHTRIPLFIKGEKLGGMSATIRTCTFYFKIKVVQDKILELVGEGVDKKNIIANTWLGITMDEFHRSKPSQTKFIKNTFPLLDLDMTRGHCFEWMEKNGYRQPPKSACYMCAFRDDKGWNEMKLNQTEDFNKAVMFEKTLQEQASKCSTWKKNKPYLHKSLKPLNEVNFDVNKSLDLFGNECEGFCGV